MDRAPVVVLMGMTCLVCGCAGARSSMPPNPTRPADVQPVEMKPLEPIQSSINEGKIPKDPSTVRASYTAEQDQPTTGRPIPTPEPFSSGSSGTSNLPPRQGPSRTPQAPPVIPPTTENPAPPVSEVPPSDGKPDPIPLKTSSSLDPGKPAARTAAIVGGTVITFRELKSSLCRALNCKPHELGQIPKDQLNMMAKDTLDNLIDRVMILQEAKREIGKKPANWTLFTEHFEKQFRETKLPMLLRQEKVNDEFALVRKLEERGESFEELKTVYIEEAMAREVVMLKVHPLVEKPGKPEMDAYYARHRLDPDFQRDPQIVWNEILIAPRPKEAPEATRTRAEAIRNRLLAGEDFARLAKTESSGSTSKLGGLWETAPNAYAVPAVNLALNALKPGQISGVIQGPQGLHVVKLVSRWEGGPIPFVEMQRKIAEAIYQERFKDHVNTYLKKLRERTMITSPLFQGTESEPTTVREGPVVDPNARQTSGPG